MSANREAGHDMTDRDITLLLADAADGVEVGIAPTQAMIRGGRRRRARRWAVATAAAVAIVGSTGTMALAGLAGGDGHGGQPAATQPTTRLPDTFEYKPHRTELATGIEGGRDWRVFVDVWDAPRDEAQAQAQLTAMSEYKEWPPDVSTASDLVGKSAYFVNRSYGEESAVVMENAVPKGGTQAGTDLDAGAIGLKPGSKDSRLVIGRIAKTAQQVTCYWKDGTSTDLHRVAANTHVDNVLPQGIRSAEGSPDGWFACLAPEGTAFKSVKVTK
ncbi:hypothetical protein ACFYO2_03360 [Streptomyces sp. NPDC006602]|uniref:hypothetical protein n=1 Tax=Streptomyces sp. NPDC006602 TaxID=3364751 RepID=UPI0036C36F13